MTDRTFTLYGLLLYISFITSRGRAQCASSCSATIPYNYDIKNVWCVPGAFKTTASVKPYSPGVQGAPKGLSPPMVCSTVNQNGYTQVCPTPRGISNSITQQNAIAINEASGNYYSNIKTPVIPLNAMSQETRIAMKQSPGNYMYPDIPKPFKATIHACLAGYDGEIFQIINEIKKTSGTEIEVHFYLFHRCKFNHLGSHLTNVKCLQEVLARYHHYICLNKKYVESYSEKEHCWYIEKLIMIPAFHREVDLLQKNIPIQDFTKICDVSNEKTGFEPLVLEIDEKVGDKKDMQKIKETENKYEICIDHIKDICENKVGVNNEICTKSSQDNCGTLDASFEKNQMMQPVNFQGNFMAQKSAVTTDQSQNIFKNVNSQQNGYVVARKQAQQSIGYDFKYGFPQPAQGFGNNVYTTKPYTIEQDRSKLPMSYSNGVVCSVPCGNMQNGQAQEANLWYKNVPNTNVEMPIGYNVNNIKNDQIMFPCYNNNVFSSYINNPNNIPASKICKYETQDPTNIVDKLTSDCVKMGSIVPNLIPLKVNRICQTMNNVITSPINNAIQNIPCGLIVPETRNIKSVSSENNKNLHYLPYCKPYPNVCQWVNYGTSNTQTQNTGQFKYDTVVPKAAIQTEIPTVCSNQNQPCVVNQKLGYSTVVPYSPILKIVTPSYGSKKSYMQPCIASQGSQKSANQAYITSHSLSETPVPVCESFSSNTQKNAWPVPESLTVCYTSPTKIPVCASSLYSTQNQQIQKSIWPLQYSGAAKVCHAQSSKIVDSEFVCAPPSVSESISPQKSFKQICDSNSFYTQRQNSRQSGYQQTFVTPQRICLSPGIWQKQGYRTTVPYAQPTYYTPSTKAVLPTICAEPAVPVGVKQISRPATSYVKAQKKTKANYNTLTTYMQPEQGSAREYSIRGSGYSLSDNGASAVCKKQEYGKICSYTKAQNNLGSEFWASLSQRPAKICASSNVGVTPKYDAISTNTQPLKTRMKSQICYAPTQKNMLPEKVDYEIIGSYNQPPRSTQPDVRAFLPFVGSQKSLSSQTGVKNEYVSIDWQTPKNQKQEYGSLLSYTPTQIGVQPNYDMISGYTPRPKSVQSNYIPLESKQKNEPGKYEGVSVQMPRNSLNIGHDTVTFSPKSGISEKGFPKKDLYPLSQVKYQETPIGQYTGKLGQAIWPNYQNVPLYTSIKNGPNEETYNTMSDYTPGQKSMHLEKNRNNIINSYSSPPNNEGQVYEFVQSIKPLQAELFAKEAAASFDNGVVKKGRKPDLDVISSYAPKPHQDVVNSYTPSQDSLKNYNDNDVPIGTSVVRPIQPTHTSVSYVPSKGYNGIPPEVRNAISPCAQPQRKITPNYVSLLPCDQKSTLKPGLRDHSQGAVSGIPPEIGRVYETISSYTKPQRRITPDNISYQPCDGSISGSKGPTQGIVSGKPPEIGSAYNTISSYPQSQRIITPGYVSLLPSDQKLTSKSGLSDPTQDSASRIPPEIGSAYDTISSYTQPQRSITSNYVSLLPCDQKITSKPGFRVPTQDSESGISPEIGNAYDTIPSYTQLQRKITPYNISYRPCYSSNPGLNDPTQGILSGMPPEIGRAFDKISYTQPQRRITPNYVSVLPCDQKLSSKLGLRDPTQDSVSRIPAEIGSVYDKIPSYSQPQRSLTTDYVSLLPCNQKLILKSGFRDPTQDSISGIPPEIGSAYDTISSYTKLQRKITPDYVSLLPCDQKLTSKSGLRDSSQVAVSGIPSEISYAFDTKPSYTQPHRSVTSNYVPLIPCDKKLILKPGLRVPTQDSVSGIPPEIGSAYDTIPSYTQPQRRIIPDNISYRPCDGFEPGSKRPAQGIVSGIKPETGSAYDTISSYTQPQRIKSPDYISLLPCDQKLTSKLGLRDPTQDSASGIPAEIGSAYDTISSYTQPQIRITPDYISLLPCDQKLSSKLGSQDPSQDSVSGIPSEIGRAYDTISSYTQPQRRITPNYVSLLPCGQKFTSKPGLRYPSQGAVSGTPPEIGSAYDTISSYTQPQRSITPDYVSLLPSDQRLTSKSGLRDPTQDSASRITPEIGSAYDTISSYTQPQRSITSNYVSLLPYDQKLTSKPGFRGPTQDSESGISPEIGSAYDTLSSSFVPQRKTTHNYISYRPCESYKPGSKDHTQGIVSGMPPEIGSAYETISSFTQPQRRITPDYVSLLPCDQTLISKPGLRHPSQDAVSGIQLEVGDAYNTISSYTQPQRRITPDYVSLLPCDQKLTSKAGLRDPLQDRFSRIPLEIGSAYDTISSYTQPQRRNKPDYISYRPCDGFKPGSKGPAQGIRSGTPPEIGTTYDTISSYTQPDRKMQPDYVSLLPCDQIFTSKPGLKYPSQGAVSDIPPEIGSAYDKIPSYTEPQRRITPDYVSLLPCDQKLISKPGLRDPSQDSLSEILPEIGSAYDTISSYTQPQTSISPDYIPYRPCDGSEVGSEGPTQDSVSGIAPEIGSAYDKILSYTQPQRKKSLDYVSLLPCDQTLTSKPGLRDPSQDSVSGIPPEFGSAYDTISSYTQPQRNITPDQVSSLPCNDVSSSGPQYDSRSRNDEDEYEKVPAYTEYPCRLSKTEPHLHNGRPGFKPDEKGNEEFDNINSYTQKPKSITPDINVPCSPSTSALENLNAIPSYTQQTRSFKQIYDKIAPHLQYPKTANTGYKPLLNAQPSVTPQKIKEKYDFIPSYTSQPKRLTPDDEKFLSYTKPSVIPKVTQPVTPELDSVVSYIQPKKNIELEYGNPKIMSPEFVPFTQPYQIPKDVQQNYDAIKSYSQYPKSFKVAYDSVSSYTQPMSADQGYEPTATKQAKLDRSSSYTQYPKTMELEYSQPVVTAEDYDTTSRYTQAPVENYDTITSYAQTPKSTRPTQQSVSSYSRPCTTPKKSTHARREMHGQIAAYTKDNSKKEDYPYSQYPKNVPRYEPTVFEEPCAAPVKENYDTIDTYTKTPEIQDQTGKLGYRTIPSYAQPCKQKSKPTHNTVQYTQPIPSKLQQQVYMQNHNIRRQGYIPVSYIKPNVCTVKRIRPICNKISSYTPIIRRVRPRYESIQYTKPKLSLEEANQPYDSIASYNQVPHVPYPKPLNPKSLPILSYIRPCSSKKEGMFVTPRYQSIPSYTKQIVPPKPRYDHIQSYLQPSVTTLPMYQSNQPCNYQSIPSNTKQTLPLKPKYDHIQSYMQPSVITQPVYPSKQPCNYQSIPSYTKQMTPKKPRHDNIQTYTQPGAATEPLYPSKQPCTPPCAPEVITSYKTISQKPIYDNIQSYTQPIQPLYPIRQPCSPPCMPDIINAYENLANNVYVTPGKNYAEYDNIKAYEPRKNTRQSYNTDPAKTAKTTAPISETILQYTRPSTSTAFKNKNYNTIGSYTQPQRNINNLSNKIMSYTRPQKGEQIIVSPQTSSSQYYDIGSYTQAPKSINDIGDQIRAYTSLQNEKQTYVTSNRGNIQDDDIIASYIQPPKSMKDICDQIMSYSKPQTSIPTYVTPSITNNQYPYKEQQENIKDICGEIKSYIKPLENQEQYDSILKYSQLINDGKQLSDTISAYEGTLKIAERVCDEIESYKNIKGNEMGKQDNDQIYSFAQPWQEVNNQIPQTKPQVKELYNQSSAYAQPLKNVNPISEYTNAPTSSNQGYGQTLSYTPSQKMATENYDTISSYAQPQERVVAPCIPLQKIPQPIIYRTNSYTQPTKNIPCMLQQISDYTRIPNDEPQVVMPCVPLQESPKDIYDNTPSYTQPSVKQMSYVPLQKLTPSKPCLLLQDTVRVPYIQPQKFKQTYDTIPTYMNIPKGAQGIVPCLRPQESPKDICDTINSYIQPLINENVYIPNPECYRGTQSVDAPITTPERSQGQVFEAITSYTNSRQSDKPALPVNVPWLSQDSAQRVCIPLTLPEQRERKIYAPWVTEQKLKPSICIPYTMPHESIKQVCVPCTSYEKGGKETVPCVQLKPAQPICTSYQKPQNSIKRIYDTIPAYTHAPKIPVCLPCIPQQRQQVCVPCMPPEERVEEIGIPCQEPQSSFKQAYDTISAYTKLPKRKQVCLPYIAQQNSRSPMYVPWILQKPSGQVCSPCIPPAAIKLPGRSFKQIYDTISAYTHPPKNRPQICLPYGTQEFGGQVYQPYISEKSFQQVGVPCASTYKPSSQICVPCMPENIGQLVRVPCQPPQKSFKEVCDAISAYTQPQEMGRVYEPCLPWEKRQQVCEPCIPGQPISVSFIPQKSGPSVCVPCVSQVDRQKMFEPCQPPQKSFKLYDAITAYTQKPKMGRLFEPCIPRESGPKVCVPYLQENKHQVCVPCIPQQTLEQAYVQCIPHKNWLPTCMPCMLQDNKQQMYQPPQERCKEVYDSITAYTQKPEIGRAFEPCMPQGSGSKICMPCIPQAGRQKVCIPCVLQDNRQQVCVPCMLQDNRQQVCVPCISQNNRQKACVPCLPPQKSFKEVYDAIKAYTQSPEIERAFEPCIPQKSGSQVCMPCMPQDNEQRVCVPCVPQLGSVEEIYAPCIPTQKPRQQICVPCLPQANGQHVFMPCIPQTGRQKVCIPCISQDNRQQIHVPCIPQDNGQNVGIPCIPGDYIQQVCVPCIPQVNSQQVQDTRPCQPPQKSFKEVYDAISAYTQPPESGRVCDPCIPTPNTGHQVCVPCVPQLGSVEEVCVPCIPSQKPRQQICVPCTIPQVRGKQVCWPCVIERSGLVCEPCIPQKSGQICVPCMPCIPQDKRQQVCVPCIPQDNTQVCMPCIPQDNRQRVCRPCMPQDYTQACTPCVPWTDSNQQISNTVPTYTDPQKTVTQIPSPYLPSIQEGYPYLPQNPYGTPNSRQGLDTKPTEGQQDTNYQKPNEESTTAPKSLIDCLKECIAKYVASNPDIKNDLYNNVGIGDLHNITLDNLAVLTNFENKTPFMTKNIGGNIELKGFMNKVKIIRPKLVLETQEIEVPNFIPVVKRNENRCQCVIQGLAKAVVKTTYSQPVVIRKPSAMDNGYMMVKDHGVSSSNAIIWPAVYQDNAWYKESKDCVCH